LEEAVSTLVDSGLESAHNCGIATLAESIFRSLRQRREGDTGQRRELLGHHQSKIFERWDTVIQRALAGLRSTLLSPAQSYE